MTASNPLIERLRYDGLARRREIAAMTVDALYAKCLADGLFLRRDAVALGIRDSVLRRSIRAGVLVRVRQGAYTFTNLWGAADEEERHLLLARAVVRQQAGPVAVSHHTAALLHGLDQWNVPLQQAHLTRLDAGAGRSEADAVHHQGLTLPEDLVSVRGLVAVRPVRAALESASLLDVERGLVVVDSGLRKRMFTAEELERQVRLMESWPESQRLQLVTRLADARSESVGESRTRYLFWSSGIPAPVLQYPVYDGGELIGVADFAWPAHRLLGEFDGKMKYTRLARPGEDPGDVVFREKQREDRLRSLTGWRMVRITWPMLAAPAETAAYVRSLLAVAA